MKGTFLDLLNGWFFPSVDAPQSASQREVLFGGSNRGLSSVEVHATTLVIMLTSLAAMLAGALVDRSSLIFEVAGRFESVWIGLAIVVAMILALLVFTVVIVIAAGGAIMPVLAAVLISMIAVYELGSFFSGTELVYFPSIVFGSVALNAVFTLLRGGNTSETSALVSAVAVTLVIGVIDYSLAHVLIKPTIGADTNLLRGVLLVVPCLFALLAAMVVGRWNTEQANTGVGLARASIPAVMCVIFVSGVILALLLINLLRKLFPFLGGSKEK
ncbi:hypothetical protein PAERUG_P40_Scotland_4_VIM_2_09_12_04047 [Pseudomonas aeruginosa]|nr:hypothetical protein [Pseudomonas aeruginosa]CRN65467.1 hypothetical protein PAERUG_P40_Scotland_4_VIM_2_09_12_04047 [Pseudomonas aeruginosa]